MAVARRSASCLSISSTLLGVVLLCIVLPLHRVLDAGTLSEPRSSHSIAPWESPALPLRYTKYTPKCKVSDGVEYTIGI